MTYLYFMIELMQAHNRILVILNGSPMPNSFIFLVNVIELNELTDIDIKKHLINIGNAMLN